MPETNQNSFAYEAFISYRHRDLDSAVARALHRQLETFRIPSFIKKQCGKAKMGKVFRDQEELPTSADLGADILSALSKSKWLIVICSPDLPLSKWCMQEIDEFIRLRGRQYILTVLIKGEPHESFPPQLRFIENEAGEKVEVEPLATDIRAESASASLKRLKKEKLRLLAPMLGVGYDDLRRRARERTLRRAIALFAAAAVFFAVFGGYALNQAAVISRQNTELEEQIAETQLQRNAALTSQSRFLADLSAQAMQSGDGRAASLLALEALPENLETPERPLTAEAEYALRNLAVYERVPGYRLTYTAERGRSGNLLLSYNGNYLAHASRDGTVAMYDPYSMKLLWEYVDNQPASSYCEEPIAFIDTSLMFASAVNDELRVFDSQTGELRSTIVRQDDPEFTQEIQAWSWFQGNRRFAVLYTDGAICYYGLSGGLIHQADIDDFPEITGNWSACVLDKDYMLAGTSTGCVALINVSWDDGFSLGSVSKVHEKEILRFDDMRGYPSSYSYDRAVAWQIRDSELSVYLDSSDFHDGNGETVLQAHDMLAIQQGSSGVRFYDDVTLELAYELPEQFGGWISRMAFYDADTIAIINHASSEGELRLWDIKAGQLIALLDGGADSNFEVSGKRIYTTYKNSLYVYDYTSGEGYVEVAGMSEPDSIRISPDGAFFAAVYGSSSLAWNADTGEQVVMEKTVYQWPSQGGRLTLGSRLYTQPTTALQREYDTLTPENSDLREARADFLSEDGVYKVVQYRSGVGVYELSSGRERFTVKCYMTGTDVGASHFLCYDEDSNSLAVYSFAGDGSPAWQETPESRLHYVRFSGDGRYIAVVSVDGLVQIREAETGELVWSKKMSAARNCHLAPGGQWMVYFDESSTEVWDIVRGEPIMDTGGSDLAVITADGKRVVTALGSTLSVWTLPELGELMEQARDKLGGDSLTEAERIRYFLE